MWSSFENAAVSPAPAFLVRGGLQVATAVPTAKTFEHEMCDRDISNFLFYFETHMKQ